MNVQLLLVALSAAFGHLPLLREEEKPCAPAMERKRQDFFPGEGTTSALPCPVGALCQLGPLLWVPLPKQRSPVLVSLAIKCFPSCRVLLQQVAKKMNLDMRKTSSLWKDQALVEINIAVLYSFQVPRDLLCLGQAGGTQGLGGTRVETSTQGQQLKLGCAS